MNPRKREEFDRILEEILAELPAYVREELNEVPVIVEDEPSAAFRKEMEGEEEGESSLCGLHSGIPLTERAVTSLSPEGSLIHIFRGPILRLCGADQEELRKQIRITLLHEIAHHFGFSEEELEKMGYG